MGTRIIEARAYGCASGLVTTIAIATEAPTAPEVNHLWPLITHSSPSSSARVRSVRGSEPATSGSVIEKQERISPSSNGASQCRFCSSVPCSAMISLLPVSGAAQLNAIGAIAGLRPISSQSTPYSQLVSPTPCSESGMNRFQRPSECARSRISTRTSG